MATPPWGPAFRPGPGVGGDNLCAGEEGFPQGLCLVCPMGLLEDDEVALVKAAHDDAAFGAGGRGVRAD